MNNTQKIKSLDKIKVVFGNGADLYCELKSTYKDYFESNIELKNKLCKIYPGSYHNFPIGAIFNNVNNAFKNFNESELNFWYVYFFYKSLELTNNTEILWCDIEESLKEALCKKNTFLNNTLIQRIFNIINKGIGQNTDLEVLLAMVILKKLHYNLSSINNNYTRYCHLLLRELNEFELDFSKYIYSQVHDKASSKLVEKKKKYLYGKLISNKVCSIDTFNYTNPLLTGTSKTIDFSKIDVCHINGEVIGKNKTDAIFGIYSNDLSPCDSEYIFTKTSRRLIRNIITPNTHSFDFENVIVFGHSLNEQDYSYFFSLFDTMKLADFSSKSTIVFSYSIYKKEKEQEIINNLQYKVSSMFNAYCKYIGKPNLNLLDTLSFQNRLLFYQIPIIKNKKTEDETKNE